MSAVQLYCQIILLVFMLIMPLWVRDVVADELTSTTSHRFWVTNRDANGDGRLGEWIEARSLQPGDRCTLADGGEAVLRAAETTHREVESDSIHSNFQLSIFNLQPVTTYNFEVATTHTYFVGSSGVWVHNAGEECMARVNRGAKLLRREKRGITQSGRLLALNRRLMDRYGARIRFDASLKKPGYYDYTHREAVLPLNATRDVLRAQMSHMLYQYLVLDRFGAFPRLRPELQISAIGLSNVLAAYSGVRRSAFSRSAFNKAVAHWKQTTKNYFRENSVLMSRFVQKAVDPDWLKDYDALIKRAHHVYGEPYIQRSLDLNRYEPSLRRSFEDRLTWWNSLRQGE